MNQLPSFSTALPDLPCEKHVRHGPGGACPEVADFVLWALKIRRRPSFPAPAAPGPGARGAVKAPSRASAVTPWRRNPYFSEGKRPEALPTDAPATRCS